MFLLIMAFEDHIVFLN